MVTRYNRFRCDKVRRDPSTGFVTVSGVIARIGVQEYMTSEGVLRELRLPEDVRDSVSTFTNKPLTLMHPKEPVTTSNAKKYMVGSVPNVKYENGLISTDSDIVITDKETIDKVMSGSMTQLSAGYDAELEFKPGVWVDKEGLVGQKGKAYEYDAIQRNIKANHVAIVDKARAGDIASLRLDSDNNIGYEIEKDAMIKYKDQEYDMDGIMKLLSEKDEEMKTVLDANKDLQDQLGAKCDRMDSMEASIEHEVKSRLEAWNKVTSHVDTAEVDYSLNTASIKKLGIAKLAPNLKLDSLDDSVVEGIWLGLTYESPEAPTAETTETIADSVDTEPTLEDTSWADKVVSENKVSKTDSQLETIKNASVRQDSMSKVDEIRKRYEQSISY